MAKKRHETSGPREAAANPRKRPADKRVQVTDNASGITLHLPPDAADQLVAHDGERFSVAAKPKRKGDA